MQPRLKTLDFVFVGLTSVTASGL